MKINLKICIALSLTASRAFALDDTFATFLLKNESNCSEQGETFDINNTGCFTVHWANSVMFTTAGPWNEAGPMCLLAYHEDNCTGPSDVQLFFSVVVDEGKANNYSLSKHPPVASAPSYRWNNTNCPDDAELKTRIPLSIINSPFTVTTTYSPVTSLPSLAPMMNA